MAMGLGVMMIFSVVCVLMNFLTLAFQSRVRWWWLTNSSSLMLSILAPSTILVPSSSFINASTSSQCVLQDRRYISFATETIMEAKCS